MPPFREYTIIILGASISGLTLALSLCHQGVVKSERIIILERDKRDAFDDRTVHLTPEHLHVLDGLNIYGLGAHAEGSRTAHQNLSTSVDGTPASSSVNSAPAAGKAEATDDYEAFDIRLSNLLRILHAEIEERKIRICYQHTITRFLIENDYDVGFDVRQRGKCARSLSFRAQKLVSCDGWPLDDVKRSEELEEDQAFGADSVTVSLGKDSIEEAWSLAPYMNGHFGWAGLKEWQQAQVRRRHHNAERSVGT